MANGDVLMELKERLGTLLKKKMSAKDRAVIETMQLFVIFLEDDHRKVGEMYPTVRVVRWVGAAFGLLNLTYLWNMLTR